MHQLPDYIKSVYVFTKGDSSVGLRGENATLRADGEWMIDLTVVADDQRKVFLDDFAGQIAAAYSMIWGEQAHVLFDYQCQEEPDQDVDPEAIGSVKPPMNDHELATSLDNLIERDFWPKSLAPDQIYTRLHDDRDGETGEEHQLRVYIAQDGDLHVFLPHSFESLRFRNYIGGGKSLRVRNALLVLAEAIRRENEQRPQLSSFQEA
jgi:hypothetical protein